MRAGTLRDFVTIESLDPARSAAGQRVAWLEFAKVYANVEPLSGNELVAERALLSPVNVRVLIRYVPGVKPEMRIRLGGRVLNIMTVVDVGGLQVELELSCVEVT